MKRILISTFCRDSLSVEYVTGLLSAVCTPQIEYALIPSLSRASCINIARNEAVEHAKREGADELVFVDADIGWTPADLFRLLSHDVDIGGADYAKRIPGVPQTTARAISECTRPDGLVACTSLPAGFLRVRMPVFTTLYETMTDRHYLHPSGAECCEYFPTGLVVKGGWQYPSEYSEESPAELISEDVGFCRLARACGFVLWCDSKLRLRHMGQIGYPAAEIEF